MELMLRIRRYINECIRVLRVTKKPNAVEFKAIVKISGLGMILIGLIGFAIQMMKEVFVK